MDINNVVLTGNLTRDPDLNVTKSNLSVCKFCIAVNRNFTNQEGKREADFINIVTFRGTADNCAKYLSKGSKVGVVGSIQQTQYEDKQGNKRQSFDIVAEKVNFLSSAADKPEKKDPFKGKAPAKLPSNDLGQLKEITDDSVPF